MTDVRLRVAICTSVHPADDARVTFREGRALARAFDTTLYTLDDGPDSLVDAGEGRALAVRRLGGRPTSRVSRFFAGRRLMKAALADRPDVVLVHDPELLPWARMMAVGRAVAVYDAHEDYALAVLTKHWLPKPVRRSVAWFVDVVERGIVRSFDLLLVADDHLLTRLGRTRVPSLVVRNYPPGDLLAPAGRVGDRAPVIAYVGSITAIRGLGSMLDAFRVVRAQVPEAQLVLVGQAQDAAGEGLAASPGIRLTGRVPYDRIAEELGRARVGLALLANTPKYSRDVPSKLYDYMAAGVPYVASDLAGIRAAVGETGGLLVDPDDAEAVGAAILGLLRDDALTDQLSERGTARAATSFTFEPEGRRLVEAVRAAVSRTTRARA